MELNKRTVPRRWKRCRWCQEVFLGQRRRLYCTVRCRKRAEHARNPDQRTGSRQRYQRKETLPIDLRIPAHGNGQLRVGGTNNGNPRGRPSNLLRRLARELAWLAGVELLRRLSDKETIRSLSMRELVRIMDVCLRYGLGPPRERPSAPRAATSIAVTVIGAGCRLPADCRG
jgi:hypothetical protein